MKPRDEGLAQALDGLLGGVDSGADEREVARLAHELRAAGEVLRARAFAQPRDEARFVARVLARTTREDLSWRGDLRLALDFVRARLHASPALRVVAASLALHVVAAPAVAWWVLHEPEPERRLQIRIEPPSERAFEEEEARVEEVPDELLAEARAREARENARAAGRFALQAHARTLPLLRAPAQASPVVALLARRIAALRAAPLELLSEPAPAVHDTFAAVLWLEAELDRVGRPGGVASPAARRLAAELLERGTSVEGAGLAELTAACLARAWAEGLIEAGPRKAAESLSEAWLEALGEAARAELSDENEAALVQAWCAEARVK